MMVINMLQNLYNQFDVFCGNLDVYKVSKAQFYSARKDLRIYLQPD